MDNQTAKYQFSSSHSYLYKGESAKDFEKYLSALLKREYAKNLATLIESNKFIYCNNMTDVLLFLKYFIPTFSDVYNLSSKAEANNAGSSILELIKCYEKLDNKENPFKKKDLDSLTNFLLRLPTKICVQNQYLDQYAPYYANALRFFLSVLTTIFNLDVKQPTPNTFTGFKEEITNTDNKRFNDWFNRFEIEYAFETPVVQKDFDVNSSYISVTAESFNNLKIYFKDIEFCAENTFQTITDLLLDFDYVRTLEFENCIFNFWFYDSKKSLFFKNCTFNDTFSYSHDSKKEFWNLVFAIRLKDETGFNDAHNSYLEYYFINKAKKLKQSIMNENKQLPKCPNLPEEIISELECYIQTIETLLSTLGLKCFQPLENINAKKKDLLSCSDKYGNIGYGEYTEEGLLLYKGAICKKDLHKGTDHIAKRDELIASGTLKLQNGHYILQDNTIFSSVSSAAALVLGRRANGWSEWKNKSGKTLDELERANNEK